ncbi:MAG: RimK/LysX family protein [Myxococcales bacterium]
MTRSAPEPLVIGVTEYVDIPEWRIARLRAKVDTGARSSALHVENIRELGAGRVRFDVRLHRSQSDRRVTVEAKIARRGHVRPSSGELEARIFVAVRVRIGPVEREIELSLVDRGRMIFRMLIGRSALAHAFLVDPSRRYVLRKPTRKPAPTPSKAAPSRVAPVGAAKGPRPVRPTRTREC